MNSTNVEAREAMDVFLDVKDFDALTEGVLKKRLVEVPLVTKIDVLCEVTNAENGEEAYASRGQMEEYLNGDGIGGNEHGY